MGSHIYYVNAKDEYGEAVVLRIDYDNCDYIRTMRVLSEEEMNQEIKEANEE